MNPTRKARFEGAVLCLLVLGGVAAQQLTAKQTEQSSPSVPTQQRSYDAEVTAIADAAANNRSIDIRIPPAPPVVRGAPRETLQAKPKATVDYQEYGRDIVLGLQSLQRYWAAALPQQFKKAYSPPALFRQYDAKGNGGLPCGNQQPLINNAFYCAQNDSIQWDGSMVTRLYRDYGDFAAIFVLAHEWSHAMQYRVGMLATTYTIQSELQADCFAGAWSKWAEVVDKILEPGDIDEAIAAMFEFKDVVGRPWFDPKAHGTAQQRIRSFNQGYDGRSLVEACVGG
jgi:predicted metalloprotease